MKYPTIKHLSEIIKEIKGYIRDEYIIEDESIPGIDLTIGHNPESGDWSYQTGDNSYSGGAYLYPNWAVCRVYRRSNSTELARDLIDQLKDLAEV